MAALANVEVLQLIGRQGVVHIDTRKASDYAKLCLGLLCEHYRLVDFAVNLLNMTGLMFSEHDVSVMFKVCLD